MRAIAKIAGHCNLIAEIRAGRTWETTNCVALDSKMHFCVYYLEQNAKIFLLETHIIEHNNTWCMHIFYAEKKLLNANEYSIYYCRNFNIEFSIIHTLAKQFLWCGHNDI